MPGTDRMPDAGTDRDRTVLCPSFYLLPQKMSLYPRKINSSSSDKLSPSSERIPYSYFPPTEAESSPSMFPAPSSDSSLFVSSFPSDPQVFLHPAVPSDHSTSISHDPRPSFPQSKSHPPQEKMRSVLPVSYLFDFSQADIFRKKKLRMHRHLPDSAFRFPFLPGPPQSHGRHALWPQPESLFR